MQHHFTVPVPVEAAWSALLDVQRVAPCMPGATLSKAEGNEFAGSVKVRLGPISLLYKGNGSFSEIDAEAHRVVIDASGKDSRGNGTASATVTALLTPQGGTTSVQVDTDLKVTGKPAQLGRGMISDVAGKILGQFAECLADRLGGSPEQEQPAAEETAVPAEERIIGLETGNGEHPSPPRSTVPAEGITPSELGGPARTDARQSARPTEDAIDLLSTAGVPVLKRVAPIAAVLLLVVFLLSRRRRKRRG